MSQARFQKQLREKNRRDKAAAKFARRAERHNGDDERPAASPVDGAEQAGILAELAALHERFDAGEVEFDDFAAAKDALTQRLQVD